MFTKRYFAFVFAFLGGQNFAFSQIVFPKSLSKDITIEHVAKVKSEAVRILHNPATNTILYCTFFGEVFQLVRNGEGYSSKLLLSKSDHGIVKLQGAIIHNNELFLCGNVPLREGKSTKGRLVKFRLKDNSIIRPAIPVFETDPYGANRTTFDHGFNELAIGVDSRSIYITSGSRTDHGEVQDSDGVHPLARESALTAKIFRIPIDTRDLILRDDLAYLKDNGFIYAEGVRNAFSMAFNANGRLFAVSNSGDYDHPEDMFWVRQGHHYGFPWVMGGVANPQQYSDFRPDPSKDRFISKYCFAWLMGYFHNDPGFPSRPKNIRFTESIRNLGPDANEYRDVSSGIVRKASSGMDAPTTFNAHSSPVGLVFDTRLTLNGRYKGGGFVLRHSGGGKYGHKDPNQLKRTGRDLLHLTLTYNRGSRNYDVKARSIVEGFSAPTDAILIDNSLYIIEYSGSQGGAKYGGSIWKINFSR